MAAYLAQAALDHQPLPPLIQFAIPGPGPIPVGNPDSDHSDENEPESPRSAARQH